MLGWIFECSENKGLPHCYEIWYLSRFLLLPLDVQSHGVESKQLTTYILFKGMLAAEAAFDAIQSGKDDAILLSNYPERLRESWVTLHALYLGPSVFACS